MSRRHWLWVVVLAISIMNIVSQALRPLLPVDETRYVSVAWEMWNAGQWLVPQLNGAAYDHKPPLLFWLIHAGWAAFGVSEWWPRLIAPACTLLSVLALERLARRLWPDRPVAGRMGSLIFLSSFYVAFYQTAVMFDMLLLACVSWGWVALHRAVTRSDWPGWLGFGLATGLGILAKGPVALVYLLPPLLLARAWAPAARPHARWHQPTIAAFVAAAIPLAWLLGASGSGSADYFARLVFDQTVHRISGQMGHPRPWYWYLPLLWLLSLPWSLWPPLLRALKQLPAVWADRPSRFAMLTAAAGLVVLSLVSGKQAHYLIPLLAIGALVAGRSLCESPSREPAASFTAPALLMGGAGVLMTFAAALSRWPVPDWMLRLPWWSTLLSVVVALTLLTVRVRGLPAATRVLATATVAFCAITMAGVFATLAPRYDLSGAASHIARQQSLGRDVAYVGDYQDEFTFLGGLRTPLQELRPGDIPRWAGLHPGGLLVWPLKRSEHLRHPAVEYEQPYRTGRLLMFAATAAGPRPAAALAVGNRPGGADRRAARPQPPCVAGVADDSGVNCHGRQRIRETP